MVTKVQTIFFPPCILMQRCTAVCLEFHPSALPFNQTQYSGSANIAKVCCDWLKYLQMDEIFVAT